MAYTKIIWQDRSCRRCNKTYKPTKSYQKFCSRKCCSEVPGSHLAALGIPTGTVGALSELEVCCDLLRKGYAVYRAVSPACKCDLMAFLNGTRIRVEVTTGYYSLKSGKLTHPSKDKTHFDVLAVCTERGIVYQPPL